MRKKIGKEKILFKKIRFRGRVFDVFLRPDADESVAAEIFNWQEYKSAEEIISSLHLPILDVGAHIGIFSLYAKAINPSADIYALEPEEDNFELLKKNISSNNLEGVRIFKAALAGRSGTRDLILENDSINHHLSCADGLREPAGLGFEKVAAISLEDFLENNRIDRIGLLKMDIEGGEYEVFRNLEEGVFSRIDNIVMEYHSCFGDSYREIEDAMRLTGFSVQTFPSGFEKGLGFLLARNKRKSGSVLF